MNDSPRTSELQLVTLLEEKETVGMASSCSIVTGQLRRALGDKKQRTLSEFESETKVDDNLRVLLVLIVLYEHGLAN
jgi:hypothetical protein